MLAGLLLAGCTEGYAQPQAAGDKPAIAGGKTTAPPRPSDVKLASSDPRQSGGVIAAGGADAVYNYGPTVMLDHGLTRMWWCSQYGGAGPAGDDVLYAQAQSIDGPFAAPGGGIPAAVFSGAPGNFDGMHTCDPSVLRVGSTYYLYYTGAAGDHALGNAIGLATSGDGVHWTRAAGGKPILGPSHDLHRANVYGAGQPSAVYLDGWFYLMFTDTTGRAAGENGAGQFVLRSPDPAFASGVQALDVGGFVPVASTAAPRQRSVVDGFSADLMWAGALDAWVIAHETDGGTTLTFWTPDFAEHPFQPVVVPGPWKEGPGLVRRADGHAPLSTADPCDRVPFDVVRATAIGGAAAPTGLRHYGLDLRGSQACGSAARVAATFDGVTMPSPERTMDLVRAGKRVRVDRRAVAVALAGETLEKAPSAVASLPVVARLRLGAEAVLAPGRGFGLVLDDRRLWRVPDDGVVALNGSSPHALTTAQWDGYARGSSLGG
ncbi:beta-xylosidase [Amycolatopsis sp., V23-08]|uniref:Beta-xylosidase n=1 Tax=Amycolatopsis heterodermiae TaxID=3110235 RepID=A0ABU5RKE0_9PSEU|nr:beta-xylosidase [Amycolatopsis sp., V23-08]MEA5366194.1 beta-xylosidase [Amycolatopsis sp., V23-08]